MAAATLTQSILGRPAGAFPTLSRKTQLLNFRRCPPIHSRRYGAFSLRCMSEEVDREKLAPAASKSDLSSSGEPQQVPPTPTPPKQKVSTNFSDLFAFSGPAPERINGRLAMIGFVAAMAVELSQGQDLFAQISGGGIPWFLGTSVLLSAASLVPLFKGVRAEVEKEGFMNADAELWNGRFAMLGLVALAFTEYVKGGALV